MGAASSNMSSSNARSLSSALAVLLLPLLLCVLGLVSCGGSRAPLGLVHDGQTALDDVIVTGSYAPDFWGHIKFHLVLTNGAEEDLTDVVLIFNDEFRCDLGELLVHRGFWDGSAPFGRSTLRPGETVQFSFSHDVPNRHFMVNAEGECLPGEAELIAVTMEAEGQVGRWSRP